MGSLRLGAAALALALASGALAQDPYWVSPTGAAAWGSAQSATALGGTAAASLATATANASAGDTIYLRGGDYPTGFVLNNRDGTSENRITFAAHTGETPAIKNATDQFGSYCWGLYVLDSDYVTVRGLTVVNQDTSGSASGLSPRAFQIEDSDYFEGDSITLDGNSNEIQMHRTIAPTITDSVHGWLHGCLFYEFGTVADGTNGTTAGDDLDGVLAVSFPLTTDTTSNWTIEDCTMHSGAHHVIEISAPQCVVRNNHFYNDSWLDDWRDDALEEPDDNGLYGNRIMEILYAFEDPTGRIGILSEGNRMGATGTPSDENGDAGCSLSGVDGVIVRYNTHHNCESVGIYFKGSGGQTSDRNAIYNCTIFDVGNWPAGNSQLFNDGVLKAGAAANNAIKNLVIWEGPEPAIQQAGSGTQLADNGNVWENNWVGALAGNGESYAYSATDPLFRDETLAIGSTSQPDLRLQSGSGAIDNGGALTLADGAGSGSTSLTVDDAKFFQDGTWGSSLSNIQPDQIAVGSVSNVASIAAIDYDTNVITLAGAISWADNAEVWLYKKSDGQRVLYGAAPDQGAHEFVTQSGTLDVSGEARITNE